jgi:hypothetical protein
LNARITDEKKYLGHPYKLDFSTFLYHPFPMLYPYPRSHPMTQARRNLISLSDTPFFALY